MMHYRYFVYDPWSFPEWEEMYDYQFVRIGEEHE